MVPGMMRGVTKASMRISPAGLFTACLLYTSVFEGSIEAGQCVRIMTGAPMPDDADSVVKYEIVDVVTGDGKPGSLSLIHI